MSKVVEVIPMRDRVTSVRGNVRKAVGSMSYDIELKVRTNPLQSIPNE